ncbi:MAG: fluoride efflux transporter CrcB [Bacteroidales bacterium]|nr:fluoride efflux transporter CrcB [Bacteroidales bacterium]
MLKSIMIVGLGGFIGTVLRFLVSRSFQFNYATVFPWGTLTVNILGSFLIGVFLGISEKGHFMSPEWRLFLTIGLCGGFTTFSSFSNEAFMLLQGKELLRLAYYSGLSVFLGIGAVILGRLIIKTI